MCGDITRDHLWRRMQASITVDYSDVYIRNNINYCHFKQSYDSAIVGIMTWQPCASWLVILPSPRQQRASNVLRSPIRSIVSSNRFGIGDSDNQLTGRRQRQQLKAHTQVMCEQLVKQTILLKSPDSSTRMLWKSQQPYRCCRSDRRLSLVRSPYVKRGSMRICGISRSLARVRAHIFFLLFMALRPNWDMAYFSLVSSWALPQIFGVASTEIIFTQVSLENFHTKRFLTSGDLNTRTSAWSRSCLSVRLFELLCW